MAIKHLFGSLRTTFLVLNVVLYQVYKRHLHTSLRSKMSNKKTTVAIQDVQILLNEHFTHQVSNIYQLAEGEESQAFCFVHDSKEYVIRINRSAQGFYKDAYAYQHFASKALPIPKVIAINYSAARANGEQLAFCITEKMPGVISVWIDRQRIMKSTFRHFLTTRYGSNVINYVSRLTNFMIMSYIQTSKALNGISNAPQKYCNIAKIAA